MLTIIIIGHRTVSKMNKLNSAASMLPIALNSEILILPETEREKIEEIRLRAGQAMTVLINGEERLIAEGHTVTVDDLESVLECATGASVHAVETSMANGYINVDGGIRLGICGNAIMRSGAVCGIRNLSSLSLRIPKEIRGVAANELRQMNQNGLTDILIASPPGSGKTTCLREFIRVISDSGKRISVADERGEIAAVSGGTPQFDVGRHTDIISNAPKAKAAMMLIRAMNPDVLAMDEISSSEDMQSVFEASGCGVRLLATVHARDLDDLYSRKLYRRLMQMRIFKYCLFIENSGGNRSYRIEELKL